MDGEGEAVDINFTKLSVQLQNQEALFKIPSELFTFDCIDEGNVAEIYCPADVKLLLKAGAKVMVVCNISDDVMKGTAGTFVGVKRQPGNRGPQSWERVLKKTDLVKEEQVWNCRCKTYSVSSHSVLCMHLSQDSV